MRELNGKTVLRRMRKICSLLLSQTDEKGCGQNDVKTEIRRNFYLIRSCVRTVLGAERDLSRIRKGDSEEPGLLSEICAFCELSSFRLESGEIRKFLIGLGDRRELSYGEIGCLIPAMEYFCLETLAGDLSGTVVERVLRSLHVLHDYDCADLNQLLSRAEAVLNRDDVFVQCDDASKNLYRIRLREYAAKHKQTEREAAVELMKTVRSSPSKDEPHLGAKLLQRSKNRFYFPVLILISLLILFLSALLSGDAAVTFLSAIPAMMSGKLICDTLFSRMIPPQILPKIQITAGNCPGTLVTVVSLISDVSDAERLLHRLDVLAHRIPIPAVRVGLLLDLPSSDAMLSETERALLDFLREETKKRNRESNRFFCAVRKRRFIPETYRFEAYGRKQGAMIAFCDLLQGVREEFILSEGICSEVKYLVTLDEDTEPVPGAVESLIGFMEYPSHSPKTAKDAFGNRYVSSGYAIAAPRIEADPKTSYRTAFSSISAGNSGSEFYKNPHFNLHQDLFLQGIFCGKGILRPDLYRDLIGNRFRDEPILSHDLPEGEILRCANLTDTVFFDEIPNTVPADEKRTHRWIRGDFQNACFLRKKQNHSHLFRFKILNNLFRALFPFCCFSLIVLSPALGWNGEGSALLWIFIPILLRIPHFLSSLCGKIRKYHPCRDFFDALSLAVLDLLLLPTRALNGLDGAIRGTVRMFSGKKKLEWVTAAGARSKGKEIGDYYLSLPWQLTGFFTLFSPWTAWVGIAWLAGPLVAYFLSRPRKKERGEPSELLQHLRNMWQFYVDFMTSERHFLIPDNYQEAPKEAVAERTSPTNIGLSLLSVLGAYDLGFIDREELVRRLSDSLDTVEKLPKWRGHLFNWYDTKTLKVLPPSFISTVDCGNFAVALYTLAKGLETEEDNACRMLAKRVQKILFKANFADLYDDKKKLFYLGYDCDENCPSRSYYDLYASEARLTSYFAVMTHQVPVEHWATLARPSDARHGNFTLFSWSGTAFEYFMPHIFLPAYRRTLSGEVLRGSVLEQMGYAGDGLPWGISESGYYAFDDAGNYQYRAFGIPSCALRRDLGFPKVISPYTSFLAYPWFPRQAEKNLRRLPKGKYGYYEAVDYRLGKDNPRLVQSYMAHHLGMSFLSGVNVLRDGIMRRRFMAVEGEAYSHLLTESLPAYTRQYFAASKGDTERFSSEIRIDRPDPGRPKVCLLRSGIDAEVVTDSGSGYWITHGLDVTKYSSDPQCPAGIFLFLKNKGNLYGATYAPLYSKDRYKVYLDASGIICYGSFSDFDTRLAVTHGTDSPVSIRRLTVKNNLMTENGFEFFLTAEPVLCKREEYEAHPEYKDLFVTAYYEPGCRTVSFCRKINGTETWLSVTASSPFRFDVRRDSFREYADLPMGKTDGAVEHPIFPGLVLRGALEVRGRGSESVCFYLSTGNSRQESLDHLKNVSELNFEDLQRKHAQYSDAVLSRYDLLRERNSIAEILPRLLMPSRKSVSEQKMPNSLSRNDLWKRGISGDAPMITVFAEENNLSGLPVLIKMLRFFRSSGIDTDLVILFREKAEYQTPVRTAVTALLPDGDEVEDRIHVVNIDNMEEYELFRKVSRVFIRNPSHRRNSTSISKFKPILTEGSPIQAGEINFKLGRGGYGNNRSFLIPKTDRSPYRPWSLVLANPRFGTVLNERGLGYTFSANASECRITPRVPGRGFGVTGERLYAVIRGKKYDLLYRAAVCYYPDRAVYTVDLMGHRFRTEIFVAKNLPVKMITVSHVAAPGPSVDVIYAPQIILGKIDSGTVVRRYEDRKLFYTNSFSGAMTGCAFSYGIGGEASADGVRIRFSEEQTEGIFILGYAPDLRSARRLADLLNDRGRVQRESLRASAYEQYLEIETPDEELNVFVNGFLQQQVRSARLMGRTGPSQPGGAYGFRDQLQDSLCIGIFDPSYLKSQIFRCCQHQFEEGDVLHWWHPGKKLGEDGIRTRFSDDPYWLAYACAEYDRLTEDKCFFLQEVSYCKGAPLQDSEKDRYFTPERSELRESVYLHGLRALKYAYKTGKHGLILFGAGDWNDGMNQLPPGSETVWGSMFALLCLEGFLPLCDRYGCSDDRILLEKQRDDLRKALDQYGFLETHFARGYDEKGVAFGVKEQIDLMPQSFAVFCGLDGIRIRRSLDTAYERLWNPKHGLIRLLTPPYGTGFPGTIGDYPPGVRENGGQYTHAGVWFARALYEKGDPARGWEILSGLNPVSKNRSLSDASRYCGEPYVLAGDVYSLSGREGFCGWSHYTGAAGWYLKTVTENLLGIRRASDRIEITPQLPDGWPGYTASIRFDGGEIKIRCKRGSDPGIYENGEKISSILLNGRRREIVVIV